MSENEVRATAVREAAAYLERIYKRGMQSRDSMLADLDTVAFRMDQGMTARGSARSARSDEAWSTPMPLGQDGTRRADTEVECGLPREKREHTAVCEAWADMNGSDCTCGVDDEIPACDTCEGWH